MAKLSEKRLAQLKEAQRKYRENKRLNGQKQINIWISSNQETPDNLITSNQDLISNNQLESVQNQLAQIKAIVSEYESKAHPLSVRWDVAKKLIADLKAVTG